MSKEKKLLEVEIIEKCPRCGSKGAVMQSTCLLSLKKWRNFKKFRLCCTGKDKRKPPRKLAPWEEGRVPMVHRYPDCHQMYTVKIKVLGIEPE